MSRALSVVALVVLSALATPARAQDAAPAWFDRTLRGTIGERPATMDLRREDDRLHGTFRYEGDERDRWTTGTIRPDGRLLLDEYDDERRKVGILTGRFVHAAADGIVIRGTYVTGEDSLPFALRDEDIAIGASGRLRSRVVTRGDSASGYVVRAEVPTARPADEATAVEAARLHALVRVADSIVREEIDPFVSGLELDDPYAFGPPIPSTWEVTWNARFASEALVSLEFDVYVYYTGAAHPNSHTFTLNWAMADRRALELGDLFRDGTAWVDVVSERAIERIGESMGEWAVGNEWVRNGAGPDPANFASWTIDPAGLRIVFDPYQVAPYAAGPQTVTIPWDALVEVLEPDGPWTAVGGT